MHSSTTLIAAGFAILSIANAKIDGFAAPSTVGIDKDIPITIITSNYVQTVADVAMAFGVSNDGYSGDLGTQLDTKVLGPQLSNTLQNITHTIHIPKDQAKGKANITAALFSLWGENLGPGMEVFALNVMVGGATSSDLVESKVVNDA